MERGAGDPARLAHPALRPTLGRGAPRQGVVRDLSAPTSLAPRSRDSEPGLRGSCPPAQSLFPCPRPQDSQSEPAPGILHPAPLPLLPHLLLLPSLPPPPPAPPYSPLPLLLLLLSASLRPPPLFLSFSLFLFTILPLFPPVPPLPPPPPRSLPYWASPRSMPESFSPLQCWFGRVPSSCPEILSREPPTTPPLW